MPMSDCFIGYRLRQRLNEMEAKLKCKDASPDYCMCGAAMADHTGWEGHSPVSERDYCEEKMQEDAKKCLTNPDASTTSTAIGGDVAGVQPVKDDQGDLK